MENNQQPQIQITKLMNPITCPHCQREFWSAWEMMTPRLSNVFSVEESEKAQASLKEKIEKLDFKDQKIKETILKNIDNTPLTESDVNPFYNEIIKSQLATEEKPATPEKK